MKTKKKIKVKAIIKFNLRFNIVQKQGIKLSDHFSYGRLVKYTLPSIAMMIFTSIYGMVDGLFVSNFAGKVPFTAVNIIMPFLMIVATVGFMFGTGGTALVAKKFGEGEKEKANELFSLFVYVCFAVGVVSAVLGIVFIKPIAILLGATGEVLDNAVVYASIILLALPFCVLQIFFHSFFPASEKPQLGLWITVASGISNMVLDAILVILLPQEYKLIGAAVATAVSQVIGGGVPLIYFFSKNGSLFRLGKARFDLRAVLKACANGSSEFMSNISMNLVGMAYNIQLLKYAGENGVAAYGVMMYVSFMFAATFIGYSIGSAPIVSYNFGARNKKELKSLLGQSLVILAVLGVSMVIVGEVFAIPLAKLFVGYDSELTNLTVSGFRIFALSFLFMGFAIYGSGFFTALNDGVTSAIISFLRTLVFQLGSVIILPMLLGIDGIWYSIIVADFMATLLSGIFLLVKRKKYGY